MKLWKHGFCLVRLQLSSSIIIIIICNLIYDSGGHSFCLITKWGTSQSSVFIVHVHNENFLNFCFWLNNVNFTFGILCIWLSTIFTILFAFFILYSWWSQIIYCSLLHRVCTANSSCVNRYRDSSFYHVKLRSSRITSQYCRGRQSFSSAKTHTCLRKGNWGCSAGRHLLTLWPISLWKKGTAVLFSGIKFHPFYTTISPCYLCMKEWIRKGWNSALMSFKVRRIHSVKISVIVSCYRCIIFGFFLADRKSVV